MIIPALDPLVSMIDLSLSKLALVCLVALVVIGPEALPGAARAAGNLYGRALRYLRQIRAEIDSGVDIGEIREIERSVREKARFIESWTTENQHPISFQNHFDGGAANGKRREELPQEMTFDAKAKRFRLNKMDKSSHKHWRNENVGTNFSLHRKRRKMNSLSLSDPHV